MPWCGWPCLIAWIALVLLRMGYITCYLNVFTGLARLHTFFTKWSFLFLGRRRSCTPFARAVLWPASSDTLIRSVFPLRGVSTTCHLSPFYLPLTTQTACTRASWRTMACLWPLRSPTATGWRSHCRIKSNCVFPTVRWAIRDTGFAEQALVFRFCAVTNRSL